MPPRNRDAWKEQKSRQISRIEHRAHRLTESLLPPSQYKSGLSFNMRSFAVFTSILVATVLLSSGSGVVSAAAGGGGDPIMIEDDHPLLENDPELLQAMEIFMAMSSEEREDTIRNLMVAVGDDPAKKAEMEYLISKLPELSNEQLANSVDGKTASSLKHLVQDDEFAKARQDAKRQLDGMSWEFFVQNEAAILEATLAGGQLSPEDAALFKTDRDAWLRQLRVIWEDVAGKGEL